MSINQQFYYGHYPWRESELLHFDFLRDAASNSASMPQRQQAFRALLETRHPVALEYFIEHFDERQLSFDINTHLHHVGWNFTEGQLRRLDTDQLFHLAFPCDYWLGEDDPIWIKKANHPTWEFAVENAPSLRFGGSGEGTCKLCNKPLHHILTLMPIPNALKVSGDRLVLETCLSCLGWEVPSLFYSHDFSGKPHHISENKEITVPEFPAGIFKETTIHLVETNSRWRWQDWASSNSRENLNRIGGPPSWVQSAEYLFCPQCERTMQFLLQLDSGLPISSEHEPEEWLWGSGGMCYGFWCDACHISGFLWQCT